MKRFFGLTLLALLLTTSLLMGMSVGAAPLQADRGAWAPNTSYAINDTVTYGGITYKCLQTHTSLTGWEPPNVPALWQPLGAPTQSGPTNTPTRTSAPVTNTPTQSGATNTPSGNCWPAWNASTAYTGGAQVSYNHIFGNVQNGR